jgi:hypothetical protein
MEKPNPVDQRPRRRNPAADQALDRYDRARAFILANHTLFATQGAVLATWRNRKGKRFGPYYRLAYRQGGRQRSIYLGPRRAADLLRRFLAKLHLSRRRHRLYQRLQKQARASLRQVKKYLAAQLAAIGITLKGYEFRGNSRAFPKFRPNPLQ